MNNIRRDELEKIKKRRKQKSNNNIAATVTSKAQKAFMKHIEASRFEIEMSRLRYLSKDKGNCKLTLGIFDNVISSRNINDIIKPVPSKGDLKDLRAAHLYQHSMIKENLVKDVKLEMNLVEKLNDLAENCIKQLNIYPADNSIDINNKMIKRLSQAKNDAKSNDKLKLICFDMKASAKLSGDKLESDFKSFRLMKGKGLLFDNRNYPGLSASTSISNSLILFRPLIRRIPVVRDSIELSNHYDVSHPIWDTPKELRTSHLSSFSGRSVIDRTLPYLGTSKLVTSLWLDD